MQLEDLLRALMTVGSEGESALGAAGAAASGYSDDLRPFPSPGPQPQDMSNPFPGGMQPFPDPGMPSGNQLNMNDLNPEWYNPRQQFPPLDTSDFILPPNPTGWQEQSDQWGGSPEDGELPEPNFDYYDQEDTEQGLAFGDLDPGLLGNAASGAAGGALIALMLSLLLKSGPQGATTGILGPMLDQGPWAGGGGIPA